jgi:hypothetical protein
LSSHDRGSLTLPRPEQELLTIVETKAAHLRHRRLQALTGAVGALVLVVGCLVLVSRGDGDPGTSVRAAAGDATESGTASSALEGAPVPEDLALPVPPVPPPVDGLPVPPGGSAPPPAGAAVVAPPAPAPPPSADQGGAAVAPPQPAADPPPTCSPSEIVVTASADRSVYAVGDDVKVTFTARNQSGRACMRPSGWSVGVADGTGKMVSGGGVAEDWFGESSPPPFQPGETRTESFTWRDAEICEDGCHPVPPGTYTVRTSFHGIYHGNPVVVTIS